MFCSRLKALIERKLRSTSAKNGQQMLKSDKFEFERGAAAKTKSEDRYTSEKIATITVTVRPLVKSPACLSPVDILSKDGTSYSVISTGWLDPSWHYRIALC